MSLNKILVKSGILMIRIFSPYPSCFKAVLLERAIFS